MARFSGVMVLVLLAGWADTAAPVQAAPKRAAEIYFLRGFGGIFSRGFDQMSRELSKRGIKAVVVGHGGWPGVVRRIIAGEKKKGRAPVVLIGHSLGANAVIRAAEKLDKAGIPVTYLGLLGMASASEVPKNVRRVENFYFSSGGWGEEAKPGAGFRGKLHQHDMAAAKSVGHFSMTENALIQSEILDDVLAIARR